MAFFISDRGRVTWIVECKGCHRDIPAGVDAMPSGYIAVRCPMPGCRDIRRYLPTQVGLGHLHHEVLKALRAGKRDGDRGGDRAGNGA